MDEFRFWKGGFWLSHLGGKPYHISALYVIDLNRFRQLAAGDNYRWVGVWVWASGGCFCTF